MSKLRVENGKLDVASLELLDYKELATWIFTRLHGQDRQVPYDVRQNDLPHYLLALIYPDLPRPVRQDMERVVEQFLNTFVSVENTEWYGDAADELLLLAQSICDPLHVKSLLVKAAESRQFLGCSVPNLSTDLHYRVLQSLVQLKWRGTPKFWHQQVQLSQDRYASVAFDGLALIGPEHAIAFLPTLRWTEEVEVYILSSFPYQLETYTVAVIEPMLMKHWHKMPNAMQAAIRQFLADEGIYLPAPQPIAINVSPSGDLNRLRDRFVLSNIPLSTRMQPGL